MLHIANCKEKVLCVDCTKESCLHHGKISADCPKYDCDNDILYDCEHCDFIKKHQEDMRKQYQSKGE